MSESDEKGATDKLKAANGNPKSISRRAVLRGGITAMPAILTLHSGAALARSSNLISAAAPDTTDNLGRTLCLDTNSVYASGDSGNVYDLGEPPVRAEINIVRDRKYFDRRRRPRMQVSESEMCTSGGEYWFNDRDGNGWQTVKLPSRGIVVSSGAMTSMADHVLETLI